MANGKKTDQVQIAVAERRVKALELRKAGASFRAIGTALDISEAQAHRDYKASMAALIALGDETAAELRAMEALRLDGLMLDAYRILKADHPLVSGGKVLSGFTDEGKPIGLTDEGPKLAAIDRLLRISESRRKLLGLDAQPDGDTINILVTPQWIELRTIILQVVNAYPDAQRALLAAITEVAGDE